MVDQPLRHRLTALVAAALIAACSADPAAGPRLEVYKDPTCGCCGDWIEHMQERGFETAAHHPDSMSELKAGYGIALRYQSCHTAVSETGHVFEGHIPAKFVEQFLAAPPPGAIGLSVPGMPVGSPGMEVDDKFMAYDVLLLKQDGTAEVYASVTDPRRQYD